MVQNCKTKNWAPSAALEKIIEFFLLPPPHIPPKTGEVCSSLGVQQPLPVLPKFVWPPPNCKPHAHLSCIEGSNTDLSIGKYSAIQEAKIAPSHLSEQTKITNQK